jgi:hypothetical protein
MQYTELPYQYVDDARRILTNVKNRAAFRKDSRLILQYTTQAGDEVEASVMIWPTGRAIAEVTYVVHDGPRSRTQKEERATETLSALLKDLNAEAAV